MAESDSTSDDTLTPYPEDEYVVLGTDGNMEYVFKKPNLIREKTRPSGTVVRVFYVGHDEIAKVYTTPKGRITSYAALSEARALNKLTEAGCKHAPDLLSYSMGKPAGLLGGGMSYVIIMSRVPGIPFRDAFDDIDDDERDELREKLSEAINAVADCKIDNNSHHWGNVVYYHGEDMCFIVDYERATWGKAAGVTMRNKDWHDD